MAGMSSCTPCGILRRRPDDECGVRTDQRSHRLDVGGPVGAHRRLAHGQAEVVRRLVERGVGRLGQHDLRLGDPTLLRGPLTGGEHGAEDRLGAAAREEPGHVGVTVQEARRPADRVGLDLPQRRERLRVERVLVQEERCRRFRDRVDRRAAVVHQTERAAVLPPHVVGTQRDEVGDHVVDRPAVLCERAHAHPVFTRCRHRTMRQGPYPTLPHGTRRPSHLHRTPAGGDVRRSARRRSAGRAARIRRVLPQRPLPGDGRRVRTPRPDRRVGDARCASPARPRPSGSARS